MYSNFRRMAAHVISARNTEHWAAVGLGLASVGVSHPPYDGESGVRDALWAKIFWLRAILVLVGGCTIDPYCLDCVDAGTQDASADAGWDYCMAGTEDCVCHALGSNLYCLHTHEDCIAHRQAGGGDACALWPHLERCDPTSEPCWCHDSSRGQQCYLDKADCAWSSMSFGMEEPCFIVEPMAWSTQDHEMLHEAALEGVDAAAEYGDDDPRYNECDQWKGEVS